MSEGVDYAFPPHPSPHGLAQVGKTFAMRYIGLGSASKHLSVAEREALWAAGLSIVLLAEGATNRALDGEGAGRDDAADVLRHCRALDVPPHRPVYVAVDFDMTAAQWPRVAGYLDGFAAVLGRGRVGVYGGLRVVELAARDQRAVWFFQTYAWSHGEWFAHNHVEQYRNGVSLVGGDVDLDRALRVDFGQWRPAGAPPIEGEDDSTMEAADVWTVPISSASLGVDHRSAQDWLKRGEMALRAVADVKAELDVVKTALDQASDAGVPGDLGVKLDTLLARLGELAEAPLIDAVQVAAAIAAHPDIMDALASGVAHRLSSLSGSITLSGSLSGGITGPASG